MTRSKGFRKGSFGWEKPSMAAFDGGDDRRLWHVADFWAMLERKGERPTGRERIRKMSKEKILAFYDGSEMAAFFSKRIRVWL